MSRNLCTSSCEICERTVRLSDLRGKPIEFRQYGPYAPEMGCRFDCECGEVYFAIWRKKSVFWGKEAIENGAWKASSYWINEHEFPNDEHGRFAIERNGYVEETGCFTIDLSHYATYNDEKCSNSFIEEQIHNGERTPHYLCEDDALDTQLEW